MHQSVVVRGGGSKSTKAETKVITPPVPQGFAVLKISEDIFMDLWYDDEVRKKIWLTVRKNPFPASNPTFFVFFSSKGTNQAPEDIRFFEELEKLEAIPRRERSAEQNRRIGQLLQDQRASSENEEKHPDPNNQWPLPFDDIRYTKTTSFPKWENDQYVVMRTEGAEPVYDFQPVIILFKRLGYDSVVKKSSSWGRHYEIYRKKLGSTQWQEGSRGE